MTEVSVYGDEMHDSTAVEMREQGRPSHTMRKVHEQPSDSAEPSCTRGAYCNLVV